MKDHGWDPDRYLRFGGERGRPFPDLLARLDLRAPARIVDLGCGPGTMTALLRRRWPGADVLGLDASEAMIEKARSVGVPGVRYERADLHALQDAGLDVDAWETTYLHQLAGDDAVFGWVSTTAARPVLQALPDRLRERFASEYRAQLRAAYPAGPRGTVLPFRRVFAVGRVAGPAA